MLPLAFVNCSFFTFINYGTKVHLKLDVKVSGDNQTWSLQSSDASWCVMCQMCCRTGSAGTGPSETDDNSERSSELKHVKPDKLKRFASR